jgi:hypothetical protein
MAPSIVHELRNRDAHLGASTLLSLATSALFFGVAQGSLFGNCAAYPSGECPGAASVFQGDGLQERRRRGLGGGGSGDGDLSPSKPPAPGPSYAALCCSSPLGPPNNSRWRTGQASRHTGVQTYTMYTSPSFSCCPGLVADRVKGQQSSQEGWRTQWTQAAPLAASCGVLQDAAPILGPHRRERREQQQKKKVGVLQAREVTGLKQSATRLRCSLRPMDSRWLGPLACWEKLDGENCPPRPGQVSVWEVFLCFSFGGEGFWEVPGRFLGGFSGTRPQPESSRSRGPSTRYAGNPADVCRKVS